VRVVESDRTELPRTHRRGRTEGILGVAEGTLLIVEDDRSTGSSLERALSNQRYRCVWATTMSQARAVSDRPSLVLLDLGLPDGDGLELAGEMLARWPGIPIVMLSARAREADVVVGLDAGAVDYVTKPFRLLELLTRVRAHLRDAGARHPACRSTERRQVQFDE
jgi:DNA-binding response OmpR family regulator